MNHVGDWSSLAGHESGKVVTSLGFAVSALTMAASSSRCQYCLKPTNSVSRHIQQVASCREGWLADVNNLDNPLAMQDRGVGHINNLHDEGWPMEGLGDDDNIRYDDAGHH